MFRRPADGFPWPAKLCFACTMIALIGTAHGLPFAARPTVRGHQTPPPASPPPEEQRFDRETFIEALRQRGLTELLDLYLKENPPRTADARLLLQREVLRARYADSNLPLNERMQALREANDVLAELIRQKPRDRRVLEWQLELAWSRVFEESEPYTLRLLYGSASAADRETLRTLMPQALESLHALQEAVDAELDRLDKLPLAEYERLEDTGYVARLERTIAPKTRYVRLWALYYDALARPAGDDERARNLEELSAAWKTASDWLDRSHPLQPQVSLLKGMSLRLAGEWNAAEEALVSAVDGVGQADPARQKDLAWVVALSWLERIRALQDAGRIEVAQRMIADARRTFENLTALPSMATQALAICERGIYRTAATQAAASGRTEEARKLRDEGATALMSWLKADPQRRDGLYAALYRQLGPDADPAALDAVERAAMLAGWLREADDLIQQAAAVESVLLKQSHESRARELLTRAVSLADAISQQGSDATFAALTAEALFNGAAAAYRLGQTGRAATWFLRVARDHPAFEHAGKAVLLAVQIAAELYRDAPSEQRDTARTLYLNAMETLIGARPQSPDALYWRFFYAQTLEEGGRFREAAGQYQLVDDAHPQVLEAKFLRARCLALDLTRRHDAARHAGAPRPAENPIDAADVVMFQRDVQDIWQTLQAFDARAAEALARADEAATQRLRNMIAEARVIPAEINLLPEIGQPRQTLAILEGLDVSSLPTNVRIRALRAKLLALVQLGRIDDLRDLLPDYVALDRTAAGETLQVLYDRLKAEYDELNLAGRREDALRRAMAMTLVARQGAEWAEAEHGSDAGRLLTAKRRLAEALVIGGNGAAAVEVLQSAGVAATAGAGTDPATQVVMAEALFGVGRYEEALLLFNELARPGAIADDHPIQWRALLGDLRCRLELKQSPRDVLKVIDNRKALRPDMGGPEFAPQFEQLRRECRKRLEPSSGN